MKIVNKYCVSGTLILFLILAAPKEGKAQEQDKLKSLLELKLEDLMDQEVISASKIVQKSSEAPGIISLVTAEQIDKFGWSSLNDILSKQPGFSPSQDYDRITVSSRGMPEGWNNNHLLMLMDGIPVNDNLYGTAYTSEITPLFLIKSIEIIRGPGSALYGSTAMNGVLTINTVSAEDVPKSKAKIRFGDAGTQNFDFLTGLKGNFFSTVVGFNFFNTDGNEYLSYDGSGRKDAAGNLMQFMTHDARKSNYLFAKIEGEGTLKGLEFQFHNQNWKFGTGHGWLFYIPDFIESMSESRKIFLASFETAASAKFSEEYVIRYQVHNIDWNQRYYPSGTVFKEGLWEYLNSSAKDIFARVQGTYIFENKASIVGGVESTVFYYDGDKEHFSNVDINNGGTGLQFPGNAMSPLRPWLERIENEPVTNFGMYIQYVTGDLLGDNLNMTLGLRYDDESFKYVDIDSLNQPHINKSFAQFSPRIAVVFNASENVTLKFLAGHAFRAPSPTELFGSNTYSLASNIRNLQPETSTNLEAAADWYINKNVELRANCYYTKFENKIDYSTANYNLSTNVYSLTTAGLESELLFRFGRYSGFINYSFVKTLDEDIVDKTISSDDNRLTWFPAHSFNIGADYTLPKFNISIQGHYQGSVLRRKSDYLNPVYSSLRPSEVSPWFSVDAKISYMITGSLDFTLQLTNAFDEVGFLIKKSDYPFDYRIEGRRIIAGLTVNL